MKPASSIKIHDVISASRANGPGLRTTVWTQGCTLACPGCFNPETHDRNTGRDMSVNELFEHIQTTADEYGVEGLTISGGEPLQQASALEVLLRRVREESELSVLVFTGFSMDEVLGVPDGDAVIACVDVLIAGRYNAHERVASGLRGSSNKVIHLLTDRYTLGDIESVPEAEIVISNDGVIQLTGIDPLIVKQV